MADIVTPITCSIILGCLSMESHCSIPSSLHGLIQASHQEAQSSPARGRGNHTDTKEALFSLCCLTSETRGFHGAVCFWCGALVGGHKPNISRLKHRWSEAGTKTLKVVVWNASFNWFELNYAIFNRFKPRYITVFYVLCRSEL